MRPLFSYIYIVLLTLTLAACGPVYETVRDYKMPNSMQGKMCVNQCTQNKVMCTQMCQMRNDACRIEAAHKADYDFRNYKERRQKMNAPVIKSLSDFDESHKCNRDCGCEGNFNSCYTICGGQIEEKQVCTAFCDQK